MAKYDLARFRTLFLAGERCDPDTLHWAEDRLRVPVVDHWWQTETAWPIAANCVGLGMLPVKAGSPRSRWRLRRARAQRGQPGDAAGQIGSVAIRLPLPPGCLRPCGTTMPDTRRPISRSTRPLLTGDAGFKDADGYVSS